MPRPSLTAWTMLKRYVLLVELGRAVRFRLALAVAVIAAVVSHVELAGAQTWYLCEPSGAYYPAVQTCSAPWRAVNQPQTSMTPPTWYCLTNPILCQSLTAQRNQELWQTQMRRQQEEEQQRQAAAEQEQAGRTAEIEAQKAAARVRLVGEARTTAENSSYNVCRTPEMARQLISNFNDLKNKRDSNLEVVDIEHIITKSFVSESSMSCYGTWVFNNGECINGTMFRKPNVAGDIIYGWKAEYWEPPITISPPPTTTKANVSTPAGGIITKQPTPLLPSSPAPTQTASAFQDGVRDRLDWE
jgi:hypothetical protein